MALRPGGLRCTGRDPPAKESDVEEVEQLVHKWKLRSLLFSISTFLLGTGISYFFL